MAKRLLSIDDSTGVETAINATGIQLGRVDFDFFTATTTGEYSGAASNAPDGTSSNYWRCSTRDMSGFVSQFATRVSTGKTYCRGFNSATWTPWREVAFYDNPTFTGTTVLPATTSIGNITSTELSYLDGVTSPIQAQLDSKVGVVNTTLTPNTMYTTGEYQGLILNAPDNTTNTPWALSIRSTSADKVLQRAQRCDQHGMIYTRFLDANKAWTPWVSLATSENVAFKGWVTLPQQTSIGSVGWGEVQTLAGIATGTTIQAQLNSKIGSVSPTFTGNVTLPATTKIGDVVGTEIAYLKGVTSAIQTQIDGKAPITDLTGKANSASPVFTGKPISRGPLLMQPNRSDDPLPSITLTADDYQTVRDSYTRCTIITQRSLPSASETTISNSTSNTNIAQSIAFSITDTSGTVTPLLVKKDKVTTGAIAINGSLTATGTTSLPAATSIGSVTSTEIGYLSGLTSAIQTQLNTLTSNLATTDTNLGAKAPLSAPTFTNDIVVTGGGSYPYTTGRVFLGSDATKSCYFQNSSGALLIASNQVGGSMKFGVPTGAGYANPLIVNDAKTTLDSIETVITRKATLPADTSIGTVTSTEISYLKGATSSIQTQIDSKVSTTTYNSGMSSKANASDLTAKANLASPTFTGTVVLPSATTIGVVTASEISYLKGVTSGIQSQIDGKASSSSPSFRGYLNLTDPSTTLVIGGGIARGNISYDYMSQWLTISNSATNAAIEFQSGTEKPLIVRGDAVAANKLSVSKLLTANGGIQVYGTSGIVGKLIVSDGLETGGTLSLGISDAATMTVANNNSVQISYNSKYLYFHWKDAAGTQRRAWLTAG